MDKWEKNRITSKCKGPEAGACLGPSRSHKDASVAGVVRTRGGGGVRDDIREGGQMGIGFLEDTTQSRVGNLEDTGSYSERFGKPVRVSRV